METVQDLWLPGIGGRGDEQGARGILEQETTLRYYDGGHRSPHRVLSDRVDCATARESSVWRTDCG